MNSIFHSIHKFEIGISSGLLYHQSATNSPKPEHESQFQALVEPYHFNPITIIFALVILGLVALINRLGAV
jgi:hypothetical protein